MLLKPHRAARGQALVETAVIVPAVVLLVAAIVDGGLYLYAGQNVETAANAVARQLEANPGWTNDEAQDYLREAYPILDAAELSVGPAVQESEDLAGGYRVYDARTGAFASRPTTVSWSKRKVTVTYTGRWTTPIPMAVSGIAARGRGYTIAATATATADTTFETW